MPFVKGHKINLGRIMPEEEKLKHSIAMLGSKNHRRGVPAWNKDKKCPKTSGYKNGCWKGDEATYAAKHIWMKVNYGKASKCEYKECLGISKTFHWANISGKYKRIRSDWKMLCVKCHAKFDGRTKCQ